MTAAASRVDTREKILDAAEGLFIEHGFAATSLRAIATVAEVNLAATHYHFGSKMGLLSAVFHRRIRPINDARVAALDTLLEKTREPGVADVLTAFFEPLYSADGEANDIPLELPSLVGRIYGEPESLTKPLLEQEFADTASRFLGALGTALPHLAPEELRWRFHLMIGSMIQLLRFHAPLGIDPSKTQFRYGLEQLVQFASAGFVQPSIGSNRT